MDDLKKCPFCGGEAIISQTASGMMEMASCRLSFSIQCIKCRATAPGADGYVAVNLAHDGLLNVWHDDREKAIKAWNERITENEGCN